MLSIYTLDNIPDGYTKVEDVVIRYKNLISAKPERFMNDEFISRVFKEIDNAQLDGDKLYTPFGTCYFSECSTGCKAVILAYLYRDTKTLINISECGENAILLLAGEPYNFNTYLSSLVPLGKSDNTVQLNGTKMSLTEAYRRLLYARIKDIQ